MGLCYCGAAIAADDAGWWHVVTGSTRCFPDEACQDVASPV